MPLCKIFLDWLNADLHPDLVPWLSASKSVDTNALCKICKKEFSLSNMGVQTVKSHSKSKKHLAMLDCRKSSAPINTFLTRQSNINSCAVASSSSSASDSSASSYNLTDQASSSISSGESLAKCISMQSYIHKSEVMRAEIKWTLATVISVCFLLPISSL